MKIPFAIDSSLDKPTKYKINIYKNPSLRLINDVYSLIPSPDWTATGVRNINRNLDLEQTALQIQTDSAIGSEEFMWVRFVDLNSNGPGLKINFSNPPLYTIGFCLENVQFNMPNARRKYRIWTFSKQDDTLRLLCNGEEVFSLNYVELSSETCKEVWSKDFMYTRFEAWNGTADTASDFYREAKKCEKRLWNPPFFL